MILYGLVFETSINFEESDNDDNTSILLTAPALLQLDNSSVNVGA